VVVVADRSAYPGAESSSSTATARGSPKCASAPGAGFDLCREGCAEQGGLEIGLQLPCALLVAYETLVSLPARNSRSVGWEASSSARR